MLRDIFRMGVIGERKFTVVDGGRGAGTPLDAPGDGNDGRRAA